MLYVFDARSLPAEVALLECHEEHPAHLTRVEKGDALTCVLALLGHLTPAQLDTIAYRHIPLLRSAYRHLEAAVAHRAQVAEVVARTAEWDREDRRVGEEPDEVLEVGPPD